MTLSTLADHCFAKVSFMLSDTYKPFVLRVIMLNYIMLSVVMLNVVAPNVKLNVAILPILMSVIVPCVITSSVGAPMLGPQFFFQTFQLFLPKHNLSNKKCQIAFIAS